jgi:hypothetical protein
MSLALCLSTHTMARTASLSLSTAFRRSESTYMTGKSEGGWEKEEEKDEG